MTNKFNLRQGIKKYYPLGFLFLIIFGFVLIQEAKAKGISVGTASDNIGIGTDTPGTTYRLNVNGNSNITGTLNVTGGITGASLGATLLNASNVSAGTFGSNSGGGNYTFPGNIYVSNVNTAGRGQSDWYSINTGSIGAWGAIYGYNAICTGNNSGACTSSNGTVLGINNTLATNNIPNSGTVFFNSGNIGIGTNSPNAKLQIAGNFSNVGTGVQDGNDRPGLSVTGYYPQIVLMAGGQSNTNHGATISLGSFDSGTSGTFKSWTLGTPGINATWMDIGYGTNTNPHLNGISGYGTTVMRLQSNGNVTVGGSIGIGNTGPGAKLDVSGAIKQESVSKKVIYLSNGTANSGPGKWYVRLQPITSGNIASVKITVQGTWNYSPVMGWLSGEYSYYVPGDGTLNRNDFRVTSTTGDAYNNLRIGALVVENGYLSIPVWAANTNTVVVTLEYQDGSNLINTNLTSTGWMSEALPAANVQSIQGDLSVSGTITGTMSGTLNAANLSAGTFGSNTGGGNYTFPGKLYVGGTTDGLYAINGRGNYNSLLIDNNSGDFKGVYIRHLDGPGSGGCGGDGCYGFKFDDQRNNNYSSSGYSPSFIIQRSGAFAQSNLLEVNPHGVTGLVVSDNGSVGIGINPVTKLDVNGTTRLRSDAEMDAGRGLYFGNEESFGGSDTGGADYGYIRFDNDNNSYNYWGDSGENSALVIGTSNDGMGAYSDVLVLKSTAATINDGTFLVMNGNAGFGTATPGASTKLNVAGRGLFTGGTPDPGDGTASGVTVGYNGSAGFVSAIQTGQAWRDLGLGIGGNQMFLSTNGSVGIGIGATAPSYKLDVAGDIRARGNVYTNANYGNGLVGVYDSTRYQGVFAMSDSYKLAADGSGTGNLYGLAWSHPNAGGVASNLNTHGLLVMENGTFLAAISGSIRSRDDMQSPIFIDRNDTSYYMDPNGTSRLNNVTITGSISGNISNATNATNASNASYVDWINYNNAANGNGHVQFMQISSNNAAGDDPTNSWVSIMKMNHGDGDTYYNRTLAFDFFSNDIYTRYRQGGTAYGWMKLVLSDTSGNVNLGTATITSGGFIYNSDVKLKKNIATIESPLTKILQLRGVTFNWKKDNTPGVGLIAQEVEKVFPELVSEQNGIKSVQYGNLVAPLIEAVKEQQKEIQSLNERIKVLEAK